MQHCLGDKNVYRKVMVNKISAKFGHIRTGSMVCFITE